MTKRATLTVVKSLIFRSWISSRGQVSRGGFSAPCAAILIDGSFSRGCIPLFIAARPDLWTTLHVRHTRGIKTVGADSLLWNPAAGTVQRNGWDVLLYLAASCAILACRSITRAAVQDDTSTTAANMRPRTCLGSPAVSAIPASADGAVSTLGAGPRADRSYDALPASSKTASGPTRRPLGGVNGIHRPSRSASDTVGEGRPRIEFVGRHLFHQGQGGLRPKPHVRIGDHRLLARADERDHRLPHQRGVPGSRNRTAPGNLRTARYPAHPCAR